MIISCCCGRSERHDRLRAKSNFVKQFNADSTVQSSREKYFDSVFQKNVVASGHPASMEEGRTRDRHEDVRRDAMDASATRAICSRGRTVRRRTAKSCGPDTPTLVSSRRRRFADDGSKKARFPGRARRTPLKPSRRECRDDLAEPVVPAACVFACRRAMGAASTRHSLRPLSIQRVTCSNTRTHQRRENATHVRAIRIILNCHCRRKRAIQYAAASRLKHCRLWNTGSPGPACAKGFGGATISRARRSFSEGGKPGDDR